MSEYFTKKDAEEFKEDIKRYLGVLSEDFQHKLGFIIDGQMDIKRELEGVKEKVDGLEQKVDGLEQKVDMIHSELIAHRDNTEVHVQQVKKKRR
jgi:archaellum component FlaC